MDKIINIENINNISEKFDTSKAIKVLHNLFLEDNMFMNKLSSRIDFIAEQMGLKFNLLAGENSKRPPLSNLERAKVLEKIGKSEDEIWEKTGWERGVDGKWKFEIDDTKAEIIKNCLKDEYGDYLTIKNFNNKQKVLGNILKHTTLYNKYPESEFIPIKLIKDNGILGKGSFDIYNDIIILEEDVLYNKDIGVLLHEIQHWIQKIEGNNFSYGRRESRKTNYEVEARNIEYRICNSKEKNKLLRPEKTEDIERKMQITTKGGNETVLGYNKINLSEYENIKLSDIEFGNRKGFHIGGNETRGGLNGFTGEPILYKGAEVGGIKFINRLPKRTQNAFKPMQFGDFGKGVFIDNIFVKTPGKGIGREIINKLFQDTDIIELVATDESKGFWKKIGGNVIGTRKMSSIWGGEWLMRIKKEDFNKILSTSNKQGIKVSDDLINEAREYKTFNEFINNIKTLPTSILRDENNLSKTVEKGVYNLNRTRNNVTNYGEFSPQGTFDDFVKEIKKNGIKNPIKIDIGKDGKIIIGDGSHRLLVAEELGFINVPVEIREIIEKIV